MLKTKQMGRESTTRSLNFAISLVSFAITFHLSISFAITCIWQILLHYTRHLDDRGLRDA